jgi:hypothetical protein
MIKHPCPEQFRRWTVYHYGGAVMSVETAEAIREKLAQSRRLLPQVTDTSTTESLRAYIEELEGKLLLTMSEGPPR